METKTLIRIESLQIPAFRNTQHFSLLIPFGTDVKKRRHLVEYQQIQRHVGVQKASEGDPEYRQWIQLLSGEEASVASLPADQ